MATLQVGTLLVLLCAAAASAALALVAAHFFYGARMRELYTRLEKADKARAHTNDMLMQARRQAEALQKELLQARRIKDKVSLVQKARLPELDDSAHTGVIHGPPGGFAPTQAMPFPA
jgi:hypothetical protein